MEKINFPSGSMTDIFCLAARDTEPVKTGRAADTQNCRSRQKPCILIAVWQRTGPLRTVLPQIKFLLSADMHRTVRTGLWLPDFRNGA